MIHTEQKLENLDHLSNQELGMYLLNSMSEKMGFDLSTLIGKTEISKKNLKELRGRIIHYAQQISGETDGKSYDEISTSKFPGEDDDILTQVNVQILPVSLDTILNYRGKDISQYFRNLSQRFEQMQTPGQTTTQLALSMTKTGISSIGIKMGWEVAQLRVLNPDWSWSKLIKGGIKKIGKGVFIVTAGILLFELLLWLFTENQKNMLGMVINLSEQNLVVNNFNKKGQRIYMNHGEMKDFMKDTTKEPLGNSKEVQIGAAIIDDEDHSQSLYFGGIYFADKNFGAFGTEGVFSLTSTVDSDTNIAVMFATPYHANNGVAMKMITATANLENVFDELYENREVEFSWKDNTGIKLISNITGESGGEICNIASITLP